MTQKFWIKFPCNRAKPTRKGTKRNTRGRRFGASHLTTSLPLLKQHRWRFPCTAWFREQFRAYRWWRINLGWKRLPYFHCPSVFSQPLIMRLYVIWWWGLHQRDDTLKLGWELRHSLFILSSDFLLRSVCCSNVEDVLPPQDCRDDVVLSLRYRWAE